MSSSATKSSGLQSLPVLEKKHSVAVMILRYPLEVVICPYQPPGSQVYVPELTERNRLLPLLTVSPWVVG